MRLSIRLSLTKRTMGIYRKFTDDELIELYSLGLGDLKISKKLNVAQNAVWSRRTKLGLIANNKRTCNGGNLTKEELLERYNESNIKKAKRRNWKIVNHTGFRENENKKALGISKKWRDNNPDKVKECRKRGKKELLKKYPNYYKRSFCMKCGTRIATQSTRCRTCSNSSRKKYNFCKDCEKAIKVRATRCHSCENKRRAIIKQLSSQTNEQTIHNP